jgi:hypothetical protein
VGHLIELLISDLLGPGDFLEQLIDVHESDLFDVFSKTLNQS